ncbi:DUF4268 domain-containing protein [Odoribacter lunatus]|uniref:DUF4268 domain-containing protein n=1 Tax=Odoribacter lunatus TaxID=2941335 RepID=UPI002040695F|nr:DUF4268 domain-containing protein [Odoribacter lunatus]
MLSKEEAKELRMSFWSGFKRYCAKHRIGRRWVLTGVKIKSVQLKFFADVRKALVLFQIDHKNSLRRYEVYECFLSYRKLMSESCGADLKWEEDYTGIDDRTVSAIYFELPDVSIQRPEDWERIYAFFVEKMILLEEAYWEYRDLINERLKTERS